MKKVVNWVLFAALVVLALAFRTVQLEKRVLHNDEANQMVRAGILLEKGEYEYDPQEHHGPTLYYLSMPLAALIAGRDFSETNITVFRMVPVLFGVGLILLILLIRTGLGWGATLVAALFTAVSTCMVYYSRFYIQETLLVFFTFGAIACGWQYFRRETAPWAVAAGVFLGLMHATKETCIIAYGVILVAFLLTVIWRTGLKFKRVQFIVLPIHVLYMSLTSMIVSAVLFSSFFTNPSGVWDSIATYLVYFERGAGANTDHVHPFYYYLQMLVCHKSGGLEWSEAGILLLGLAGVVMIAIKARCIDKVDVGLRSFLLFYTLLMTLVYSLIPYKTPWCMMSFLHGWILLAGIGAAGMFNMLGNLPLQILWCLIVSYMAFTLSVQTFMANFRYSADARNPYAYSHTVCDFLNLVKRVDDIAAVSDDGKAMRIMVITNPQDAWPLPWYLRGYENVGYSYDVSLLPDEVKPPIIVASIEMQDALRGRTEDAYQSEYWGLRHEVPLALYIRSDLWAAFMKTRGGE